MLCPTSLSAGLEFQYDRDGALQAHAGHIGSAMLWLGLSETVEPISIKFARDIASIALIPKINFHLNWVNITGDIEIYSLSQSATSIFRASQPRRDMFLIGLKNK